MIRVNDISENDITVFNDLEIGDYFIAVDEGIIWKKTYFSNETGAIQITDNKSYVLFARFKKDQVVHKIEITSIDYRRVK